MRAIATIPNDVNKLISEDDQVNFVKAFLNLIRLLNVSKSFTEFDLIEKFIDEQMPTIKPEDAIATVFQDFWNQERKVAVRQLCLKENLKLEAINQMIADYKFTGKEPLRETVLKVCNEKPKVLERKKVFDRVVSQLLDIINKFDDALGAFEEEQ